LLQAITVVKRDDGYLIVAGERRWRACQMAGLTKVDCIVKKLSDEEVATMAIVENLQRQDITPLEEAQAFQRMLDEGFADDADGHPCVKVLAQKLGIKQAFRISDRLRLLKMSEPAQHAFLLGQITVSAAWYIAELRDERKQQILLDACISGKCPTQDRLKATFEALQRRNLDEQVEQPGLAIDLLDPAVQTQINRIQKAIDQVASALSSVGIDSKLVEVQGQVPGHQAETMLATLKAMTVTVRSLERQLSAEVAKTV
jgi:ParB family transcriptional regulator, chromosome partitioning protein